ncbi:hypothetical protein LINGRAHAP2_LOCUS13282 [Linum grandiflorum]
MAVFKLSSDNQFLVTFEGDAAIYVFQYLEDINASTTIPFTKSRWTQLARLAPDDSAELEVQGVTIRSNQFTQLANDLMVTTEDGQTFRLVVNRQGLRFYLLDSSSATLQRLKMYFDWSKYVKEALLRQLLEEKDEAEHDE